MPWEKQFDPNEMLDRAMQTFWEHGYEATSVQDLLDCTGLNRGSLYATYTDKRTLFLAALRMYDEKMRRKPLAELESHCPPREAILKLFLAFTSKVSDGEAARGCFLTNTALELAAHDPEVARIVAHSQEEIEAFFARMIRKGISSGEIAGRVRPKEAARGLLASLIGVIVLTRSRPDSALLKHVVEEAMHRLD